MRRRLFVPFAAVLVLAACSTSMTPSSTGESTGAPAPSFSQFTDIPVPEGARMDRDKTLLLGQGDNWVGRLDFTLRWTSAPELFDFYKAQMPGYHWQEISSVRAAISIMTYRREERIATVQIEDTTLGAEVIITMSPANTGGSGASGPPPASAAPNPAVTQERLK
jgi:hypothetical protein